MNRITVNGKTTYVAGNDINISDGIITVDGKIVTSAQDMTTIHFDGPTANIKTTACVNCNDVMGNISAGGSVNCNNVSGNIKAVGSVNCNNWFKKIFKWEW